MVAVERRHTAMNEWRFSQCRKSPLRIEYLVLFGLGAVRVIPGNRDSLARTFFATHG